MSKDTPTRKVKLTVWVQPETAAHLRGLAAREGVTLSQAAAALLSEARELTAAQVKELAAERLTAQTSKQIAQMGDRLSRLMLRAAFEAAKGNALTLSEVARTHGAETARQFSDGASLTAAKMLRAPSVHLAQLLAELEPSSPTNEAAEPQEG